MTDSLEQRLRAAIDETERRARACDALDWRGPVDGVIVDRDTDRWQGAPDEAVIFTYGARDRLAEAEHAIANDPRSTLLRCAADREILDLHAVNDGLNHYGEAGNPGCSVCFSDRDAYPDLQEPDPWPCDTLKALAKGYQVELTP